jgi:hypothetical protein
MQHLTTVFSEEVWQRVEYRLDISRIFRGAHFERYGFRNTYWINLSGGLASQPYPKLSVSNYKFNL